MEYLRHVPNHPSYKVVPRVYKNAKGVDEVIWLHQCYWDDIDWLEAQSDISFAEWVVHCNNNPFEDWTLSHLLMYWLWLELCERFRQGLPTPNPYPPMGYKGWAGQTSTMQKQIQRTANSIFRLIPLCL